MRRTLCLCLILIGALFLAACGGNPAPTQVLPTLANSAVDSGTPVQATPSPIGQVPTENFEATQAAVPTSAPQQRAYESTDEAATRFEMPIPGTLIPGAPDPNAGLVFDTIHFERTGGISGQPLIIDIKSDGTVTRDGVPSTISPDQVTLIDAILDQINFFGIQGIFEAPGTSADTYQYTVMVSRAGSSLMIRAEDGFTPPELLNFISLLSSIAEPPP